MRLDKFLWFARLARTRGAAQALAETGHVRIDGRPAGSAHAVVREGQVLTLVHRGQARVLRIAALPARRGSASEAAACYIELAPAIDARERET